MRHFDYFRFARRWVPAAIFLAIAAAVASYFLTQHVIQPMYTATVKMEVRMGLPASGSSLDPYYDNVFAQTEAEVASQSPYVTRALQSAASATKTHLTSKEFSSAHDGSGCTADQITAVFSCSVTAHSPHFAAAAANRWAADFIHGQQVFDQARFQTVLAGIQRDERAALREIDRTRYDTLVQRETSVQVAQAQHSAEIRVVSPADSPKSPSSPHPSLNAGIAFVAVLFLVLAFGALLDTVDDSIRDDAEIKALTGLPVIGSIPYVRALRGKPVSHSSLMIADDPHGAGAEAFRLVRTNITFANVDKPPQILLVTSMGPEEGKSTVAANLALSFAESGSRVVLVDLDLHRPSIGPIFGAKGPGLTNLLLQGDSVYVGAYVAQTEFDNLGLISAGPIPPVPDRLIGSARLKQVLTQLRTLASIVIIDSPPMLSVTDAVSLSAVCDGVIFVVRPATAKRRPLRHAMESLNSVHANVIGLVQNPVRTKSGQYSYGYGYASGKSRKVRKIADLSTDEESMKAV